MRNIEPRVPALAKREKCLWKATSSGASRLQSLGGPPTTMKGLRRQAYALSLDQEDLKQAVRHVHARARACLTRQGAACVLYHSRPTHTFVADGPESGSDMQ